MHNLRIVLTVRSMSSCAFSSALASTTSAPPYEKIKYTSVEKNIKNS